MNENELITKIIEENILINRKKKDPDSCPCYNGTRCHNGLDDYAMVCLLCVCPGYDRSNDEGGCNINSKYGKWFYHKNLSKGRIWDCSDCELPHTKEFVRNYLEQLSFLELEKIHECKTINKLWEFFDENKNVSWE